MAFTPIQLPDLQQARSIVDREGRPTPEFLRWLNGTVLNVRSVLGELVNFAETIQQAQAAAETANNAAELAFEAAADAGLAIAQIEEGTLELEAVKIGGQRFVNSGGTLVPEP